MIELAVSSLGWGCPSGDSFAPWLKEVRAAGYRGIVGFATGELAQPLSDPPSFQRLLEESGLSLAGVIVPLDLDEARFEQLSQALASLGCEISICAGGAGKSEDDFARCARRLESLAEVGRPHSVSVVYHHHEGCTGETLEETERLLDLTDSALVNAMCDTGHATQDFVGHDAERRAVLFMERVWPRLTYVELKDWHPETGLDTPLGEGLCGFDRVFEFLRTRQYGGWITVEQNGSDVLNQGRTPFECARLSREFVRKGLRV